MLLTASQTYSSHHQEPLHKLWTSVYCQVVTITSKLNQDVSLDALQSCIWPDYISIIREAHKLTFIVRKFDIFELSIWHYSRGSKVRGWFPNESIS